MRLPPKLQAMVGLISVLLYVLVGASMVGSSWHWVGVVLIGLGVFRAVVWVRQVRDLLQDDDDA